MTIQTPINHAAATPAGTETLAQNLAFLRSTVATSSLQFSRGSGGHEAARPLPQMPNWNPRNMSADAANLGDRSPVKAKANDLIRNNGFASNAKRINRNNVVGSGMKLSLVPDHVLLGISKTEARIWARKVQRRYAVYANGTGHHADIRRQRSFNSMTETIADSLFENGEALAKRAWREPKIGQSSGTCFQLISVDRLSNPHGKPDRKGLRSGVYSNDYNEPVAYAIREAHPSDGQFGQNDQINIWKKHKRTGQTGAPLVMHIYNHNHVEMTRGISEFVTAIKPLKMLNKYSNMTLEKAIIQNMFAATIKSDLDYNDAMIAMGQSFRSSMKNDDDDDIQNPVSAMMMDNMEQRAGYYKRAGLHMDGVSVNHLAPNDQFEMHRSEATDNNFDPFTKNILREVAAGLGSPITNMSQNYADVNYSAARASLLDVWRNVISIRNLIISGWNWPAFSVWLEEEILTGAIKLPKGVDDFYQAKDALLCGHWYGVGKPLIDPLKERKAQAKGIEIGVETKANIAASEGHDIEDLQEQAHDERLRDLEFMAEEKAYAEKLGLTPEDLGETRASVPSVPKKKSKKKELEAA